MKEMKKDEEIKVNVSGYEFECSECHEHYERSQMYTFPTANSKICLDCSDLGHLIYLPSGNTAITRRSKKYSTLSAIIYKFSKSRRRYERQGMLVEREALEKAEIECSDDEGARKLAREKAAIRRNKLDKVFIKDFSSLIREVYPNCPLDKETEIAEHACEKHSNRVGRSASAKEFDETTVHLAVRAHIRHRETNYDNLLMKGSLKEQARKQILHQLDDVANKWQEI